MKLDKQKCIFLLGGQDLEMVTIKELLKKNDIEYKDKELSWKDAELSAYKDEIESYEDKIFYAVELNIDEEKDEFYKKHKENIKIIDHHNKYIDNPTSLKQILELLEIEDKLDKKTKRDYELISANDEGYINALKCIGASDEEIEDIRRRDREAQGIVLCEYKNAQTDIQNYYMIKGTALIKTSLNHFSIIIDTFYKKLKEKMPQRIVIYNTHSFFCTGFDTYNLVSFIEKEYNITQEQIYVGGTYNSYLGTSKKFNKSSKEIKNIVESICNKFENTCQSSHILMFPFRFDYIKKDNEKDFPNKFQFYKHLDIEDRLNIKKLISGLQNSGYWEYHPFKLEENINIDRMKYYNEFVYFYDYAAEALYNIQSFPKGTDKNDSFWNELSYYFEAEPFNQNKENNFFSFNQNKKQYNLKIDGVSLRIFATGVAVLAIELKNECYPDISDVKIINEFTRRFYLPFLAKEDNKETGITELSKPPMIAEKIEIIYNGKSIYKEEMQAEKCVQKGVNEPRIGEHIFQFLHGVEKNSTNKNISFTQQFNLDKENLDSRVNYFYIQPLLDDRMFVLSWYGSNGYSKCMTEEMNYKNANSWYEYIFIDTEGGCSARNKLFRKKLIKEATYDRWSEYGTLFGISRYSFVSLTKNDDFGRNVVRVHIETHYFQMMLLALAVRTSILRFSDEIAAIATLKDEVEHQRLIKLYEKYLDFYNRLYFKEITHQDQGIELFNIALKQMKISEHIEKLDNKFPKLFEYTKLKESEKESQAINSLTIWGSVLLVPSLMVSMLSLDIFKPYESKWTVLASFPIGWLMAKGIIYINKQKEKIFTKKILSLLQKSLLIILVISIYFAFKSVNNKIQDVNIKNQPIKVQIIKNKKEENNATAKHPVSRK